MLKQFLLLALAALSLFACSYPPPADVGPSHDASCEALRYQRTTLMHDNNSVPQWKLQAKRQRLLEAYHKNNCDQTTNIEQKTIDTKKDRIVHKQL